MANTWQDRGVRSRSPMSIHLGALLSLIVIYGPNHIESYVEEEIGDLYVWVLDQRLTLA